MILSTVAASMVSLAALVLTITMVVVQLAMGQFSPRIVQRVLRDKPSQFAIGLFVATFVHAILALREVTNNGDGTGNVPGIAVVTAFVLVLVSIAVLVMYVHHIGQSLRVSSLVELVGKDTRRLLDRVYPDKGPVLPSVSGAASVVRARESGVIVAIGYEQLVEEARRADCLLEFVPALGEFVPADAPLFFVHGASGHVEDDRLHDALILKLEPTLDEDVAYGLRLLVDIAQRSLADSPFQDPTTAVQALDRLHDILRQLSRRPFPDGRYRDEAGELRLTVRTMSWDAYVRLAFDEIRLAGAGAPRLARRMKDALAGSAVDRAAGPRRHPRPSSWSSSPPRRSGRSTTSRTPTPRLTTIASGSARQQAPTKTRSGAALKGGRRSMIDVQRVELHPRPADGHGEGEPPPRRGAESREEPDAGRGPSRAKSSTRNVQCCSGAGTEESCRAKRLMS